MENYEILVRGQIDDSRLAMFEHIEISTLPGGITCILARIKDQSELFSILTQLRDMGLPLVKLEKKA